MIDPGDSNPARPGPGTVLCPLDELADFGTRGFRFRVERSLFAGFVIRRGDGVTGYVDSCPHNGFPLSVLPDRYLTREHDFIMCSVHGALFSLDDGLCAAGPCYGESLQPWPVAVVDGQIVTA